MLEILEKVEKMALDVSKLQGDVASERSDIDRVVGAYTTTITDLKAQVADLTAKLAAGETVTQADVDALDAVVTAGSAALDSAVPPVAVDPTV